MRANALLDALLLLARAQAQCSIQQRVGASCFTGGEKRANKNGGSIKKPPWGSTPISRTVVKELQPSDPAWPPFAA
ncbi:hypothetical protein VDP41_18905, partial [Xanthomonas campestris pv. campestris]|nr:hypothetical protein [Xanthomonas campestris pv. campestris]